MSMLKRTAALGCGLLLSTQALAQDRPISDHTKAVTLSPFKLLDPNFSGEYDHKLSDKTSVTAGITVGKYNNLLTRILSGAAAAGGVDVDWGLMGANTAYNYHFKHFNRGWYTGGALEFERLSENVNEEEVGSRSRVTVGPQIGYRIAGEGGFTFSWDWGLGYSVLLSETGEMSGDPQEAGLAGHGRLNLGWSF
jgi:hypothetical protein